MPMDHQNPAWNSKNPLPKFPGKSGWPSEKCARPQRQNEIRLLEQTGAQIERLPSIVRQEQPQRLEFPLRLPEVAAEKDGRAAVQGPERKWNRWSGEEGAEKMKLNLRIGRRNRRRRYYETGAWLLDRAWKHTEIRWVHWASEFKAAFTAENILST